MQPLHGYKCSFIMWTFSNHVGLRQSVWSYQFDRRQAKNLLHLWEIFIALVEIFHVYYTCGKTAITFVGIFNYYTLENFITLVGNIVTLVGVITPKLFYCACWSDKPITMGYPNPNWAVCVDLVLLLFSKWSRWFS